LAGCVSGDQTFAAASIVLFQLTAEIYMPPRAALYSTLLMATFPYILVFTTLGYSEAVFFFATISAWYFYKRGKLPISAALAGLASITRIYGIIILLPVLLNMWRAKKINLYYFIVPVAMLAAWGLYCFISVGDALASLTEESAWIQSGVNYGLVPSILYQDFHALLSNYGFDPAVLFAVALLPFLILRVWDVDRSLFAYTVTLFVMLILTAPVMSLLRYTSFIFPIWLTARVKNAWVTVLCMALFIPFALALWFYALTTYFIG